jgi:hypothetical protein
MSNAFGHVRKFDRTCLQLVWWHGFGTFIDFYAIRRLSIHRSYSRTFDVEGDYGFHCQPHSWFMNGVITVGNRAPAGDVDTDDGGADAPLAEGAVERWCVAMPSASGAEKRPCILAASAGRVRRKLLPCALLRSYDLAVGRTVAPVEERLLFFIFHVHLEEKYYYVLHLVIEKHSFIFLFSVCRGETANVHSLPPLLLLHTHSGLPRPAES